MSSIAQRTIEDNRSTISRPFRSSFLGIIENGSTKLPSLIGRNGIRRCDRFTRLRRTRHSPASSRVALIGAGWYGKCDLLQLMNVEPVEVVSICDVDSKMLDEAASLIESRQVSKKRPRTYADYNKLLAEKDVDIVLIGTPDHWDALPMIAAVESGVKCGLGQQPCATEVEPDWDCEDAD